MSNGRSNFEHCLVKISFYRSASTGDAYYIILNIGDENVSVNFKQLYNDISGKLELVVSSLQSGMENG